MTVIAQDDNLTAGAWAACGLSHMFILVNVLLLETIVAVNTLRSLSVN